MSNQNNHFNNMDTLCKHCGYERRFHIIPKDNCPGDDTHTYHDNSFFEPIIPQETLDEIISKILLQLDAINSDIQTINNTLKTLQ